MSKAYTPILEYNVVEHCNLSCKGCSHLSPRFPPILRTVDEAAKDFGRLAELMTVSELRLMGGEPLLHPELPGMIRMIGELGLAESVTIVTNGTLILSYSKELWPLIDCLRVSLYPDIRLPMAAIKNLSENFGFALLLETVESFYPIYPGRKNGDPALSQKIFQACALPGLFNTHTLRQGIYYKCSSAAFIHQFFGAKEKPHHFAGDGYPIHAPDASAEGLRRFLNCRQKLKSCEYCLGSSGKAFPHAFDKKQVFSEDAFEDLLDHDFLNANQHLYLHSITKDDIRKSYRQTEYFFKEVDP